jgi:hypothetical protein
VVDPPIHVTPQPRGVPKTTRLKSARYYLKLYRTQRDILSKKIRDHERLVVSLEREGKRQRRKT